MSVAYLPSLRPVAWAALATAGAGAAAAVVVAADAAPVGLVAVQTWIDVVVAVAFAAASLLLGREREQSRTARILGAATVCAIAGSIRTPLPGPIDFLCACLAPLFWLCTGWALLRYPGAAVERRSERAFLVGAALWLGIGHTIAKLFTDPRHTPWLWRSDMWWPLLSHSRRVADTVAVVVVILDAGIATWYLVLGIRRVRRLSSVDRWIVGPLAASIVAASAPLLARPPAFIAGTVFTQRVVGFVSTGSLVLIPLAIIGGLVRQRISRAAIADLVTTLTNRGPTDVTGALRAALRDPGLDVLYWIPDAGHYATEDGQPAPDQLFAGRFSVPVTASDGALLGAVVTDPALEHHRELVDAAVSAGSLAIENARLRVELQAQLNKLQASRRRLAEASVSERRRLERDLHDGVQQRLLALTLQLTDMDAREVERRVVVAEARSELHAALQELRELARGIHPTVLSQSGVGPALEDVLDRLPFPVVLAVPPRRWDSATESTMYYLVCEALNNVVKHARASHARVEIVETGPDLVITVADDGIGGATANMASGLAGVTDRVRALNGDVAIVSPAGAGTVLTARLPRCDQR